MNISVACTACDWSGVVNDCIYTTKATEEFPIPCCPRCESIVFIIEPDGKIGVRVEDCRLLTLVDFYSKHPEYSTKAAYEKLLSERYPPLP
jgi:hypothetical protein